MKRCEPISEIKFAAKSGFLTKDLWNEFFARGCLSWKYKLWDSLTDEKIFQPHYAKNASGCIVLNRRHNLVQKIVGGEFVSPPFVSQLDHDEKLAKIILGILKDKILINYRLEPELKRLGSGLRRQYGSEQKDKYPDALIQIANEKKTRIAIELELTKKDPKRYRQIMDTYSSFSRADMLIFVVRNDRITQTIKQAMRDSYYPNWERPVGFASLESWTENPTRAKISFAESVTSLSEIAKAKSEKIE